MNPHEATRVAESLIADFEHPNIAGEVRREDLDRHLAVEARSWVV